ncbi:MAG: carboxypeptidase-like regulatory domain-containing protein [Planctomycetota bacterium]
MDPAPNRARRGQRGPAAGRALPAAGRALPAAGRVLPAAGWVLALAVAALVVSALVIWALWSPAHDVGGARPRQAALTGLPASPVARDAASATELAALGAVGAAPASNRAVAPEGPLPLLGASEQVGDLDGPPARFEVRAQEADGGAPVAGAEVRLVRRAAAGGRPSTALVATTDAEGRATLDAPFSVGDVSVASARHVDVARAEVVAGAECVVALVASGALVGRVDLPGRGALAAPEVRLWTRSDGRADGRGVGRPQRVEAVSANGTFRFDDLDPGFVTLAVASGELPLVLEPSIEIQSGVEAFVALRAAAPVRLAGRVVTEGDRRPVAGAIVRARPEIQGASSEIEGAALAEARTALDGSFELAPLGQGRCRVTAETDYGARAERDVLVDERAPAPIELALAPSVSLDGLVLDADGAPAAGARVAFSQFDAARRVDWARLLASAGASAGGVGPIAADQAGHFRVPAVPAPARLLVVAGDARSGGSDGTVSAAGGVEVQVARGASAVQPVVIRLARAGVVSGVVLDGDGVPVVDAQVSAEARVLGARLRSGQARTDSTGRFEVLAEGADVLRFEVRAAGFHTLRADAPLSPTAASSGPRVLLDPLVLERALTVHGVVRDADGNAIAGAAVRLMPEAVSGSSGDRRAGRRVSRTDAFGRFSVGDLRAGRWVVDVFASGFERFSAAPHDFGGDLVPGDGGFSVDVPTEGELVMVLTRAAPEPRGAVSGELVALGTDDAVLGVQVDGLGRGALLLEGARFRAVGVPVGTARFVVSAPGFERTSLPEVEVTADRVTDLGRIELRPSTRLTLRIVDADGEPVRGARARLDRLPEARAGRSGLRRRLDVPAIRGGPEHRLDSTPRARWRLVVDHPTAGRYRAELDVAGARQSVTVRLTQKP